MSEEMKNTIIILLFHISLSILAIITYITFERYSDNIFKTFLFIVVPLVYIFLGYKYVNEEDSKKQRIIRLSVISLIGIFIWLICFLNYNNDDITARAERAVIPIVVPSEVVWLFYGIFNLFLFAIYFIADWIDFGNKTLNKFTISSIIFVINFMPLFFMWVGFSIKKINKRT